jgi:DNA repair protein RecN (Recombination protein N)
MIKSLYIKNFILIDELYLEFERGVNVFTGETGAGKTIILRAIDVAFGAKVSKDVLKNLNSSALIEITFDNGGEEIIISREITQTGTKPRVNGAFVNLEYIQALRENLIDIHSQNQTYTYIAPKHHIVLLDAYISKAVKGYEEKLEFYKKNFLEYKDVCIKIEKLQEGNEQILSQIEFLKFQIKEIKEAEILENEEDRLHEELEILSNIQNLKEASYYAQIALNGEDNSICDALGKIQYVLSRASASDKNLDEITQNFNDAYENLKTCAADLRSYNENLQDNPQRLDEINERLSLIEKLKRKYGEDPNNMCEKFIAELEGLEGNTNNLEFLQKRKEELLELLNAYSLEISQIRQNMAEKLSCLIEDELKKLELAHSKFKVDVRSKSLSKDGADEIEFLITTNVSQGLMPLLKVASGGEISRVMLAIKTVFAHIDKIKTIIFDEIDTGISGKTSQAVATAMGALARRCQVFMVTHQAIMAACANAYFWVAKTQNGETQISVTKLDNEQKVKALAQLASGDVNEKSIAFAQDLLSANT